MNADNLCDRADHHLSRVNTEVHHSRVNMEALHSSNSSMVHHLADSMAVASKCPDQVMSQAISVS